MKEYIKTLPIIQILLTYLIGGAFGLFVGFMAIAGMNSPLFYLVIGLIGLASLVVIWLPWPKWFKKFDDAVDLVPKHKEA